MHKHTLNILVVALGLVALCALFPPRKLDSPFFGLASREFLFSPNIYSKGSNAQTGGVPVSIAGSQLAAECILILSVAGIVILVINNKRDGK
jgi:hypothetical protein